MRGETRRRWPWLEVVLLGTGVGCLAWWGMASIHATRYQSKQQAALERMRMAAPPVVSVPAVLPTGRVLGSLDIPRLGLSAVIAEGDDDATLTVAIGHLPDTPLPWREGNSALAGHRDTFFRPLQHVRVGDELRVSTLHGDFRYHVRETRVVGPNDVWVLNPTDRPTLTLITCYPFSYVGTAPRRFIVRAERTSRGGGERLKPAPSGGGIQATTPVDEPKETPAIVAWRHRVRRNAAVLASSRGRVARNAGMNQEGESRCAGFSLLC